MSRSARLAENSLVAALTALRRALQEFAGTQPTSGRSGVTSYVTEAGSTWDQTISIGSDGSTSVLPVEIQVTYTSDGSQMFPIENIFADLRVNGTDNASRPVLEADGVFRWRDGTRVVTINQWGKRDQSFLGDDNEHRWVFRFDCYKAVTLRFKAQAAGSCGGSLSVVRAL